MNETKCRGLMGWLCGHKFQPRIDVEYQLTAPTSTVDQTEALKSYFEAPDNTITAMDIESICGGFPSQELVEKSRTYIHDVCVRCGATIKKS